VRRTAVARKVVRPFADRDAMLRLVAAAFWLLLCAFAVYAEGEPETIGGHEQAWWSSEARAHERAIEELERELDACEEREAPPAYQNVPGQVVRGRDDLYYREIVRCDETREALDAAREELDAFEDLARKLGVPPGWLR
jgi:hypothetical protein